MNKYERQRVYIKNVKTMFSNLIERDIKDNARYKKAAKRNEWIKKINMLISKGYDVNLIYSILGNRMKEELGCDPLKTIQYYYEKSKEKQHTKNKKLISNPEQDDDLER